MIVEMLEIDCGVFRGATPKTEQYITHFGILSYLVVTCMIICHGSKFFFTIM